MKDKKERTKKDEEKEALGKALFWGNYVLDIFAPAVVTGIIPVADTIRPVVFCSSALTSLILSFVELRLLKHNKIYLFFVIVKFILVGIVVFFLGFVLYLGWVFVKSNQ